MKEAFLHHIWSLQYFHRLELLTTQGEPIEVFEPGTLNVDAGPDFAQARIRIGGMQWVGSVEIHVRSSGWTEHRHELDPAYDSVILHVVWQDDRPVSRRDGTPLPTLELRGRVGESLIHNYRRLIGSSYSIPCRKQFPALPSIIKTAMFARALAARLERKSEEVIAMFKSNQNDWEETAYQWLAGAFGFKLNRDPFMQMARSLPLRVIQKQGNCEQIEALLFGQAGFLEKKKGDEYYLRLRNEYKLLSHKFGLYDARLSTQQWLFLRLRPPNFPTIRISQFSSFVATRRSFFAGLLELRTVAEAITFLQVSVSPYWRSHYRFNSTSDSRGHDLGQSSAEVILVNAVIPLLAAYARYNESPEFMEKALRMVEHLGPEENSITRRWSDLGSPPQNAGEAQGQIELFNTFCREKRCLQCALGAAIVRPPDNEPVVADC